MRSLTLTMEPIGCPETSVRNFQFSLRNNPKECSSHILHGGSLKSRRAFVVVQQFPWHTTSPELRQRKLWSTKTWPRRSNISGSLITYLFSSQSSQRRECLPELCKISRECRFNQKHLKTGAKMSTVANVSCSTQIPRTWPLTLGDSMNSFPWLNLIAPLSGMGDDFSTHGCWDVWLSHNNDNNYIAMLRYIPEKWSGIEDHSV